VRETGRSEGKIKCNSPSLVIRIVILRADVCYTVTGTDMLHRFSVNAVTVIKMKEYQVGESEGRV
jgi:hypothetical protein